MRNLRAKLVAGAAIGGAAVGGAALANAATTSTTSSSSATTPAGSATTPPAGAAAPSASHPAPSASFPAHGTAAHEDAEKPVTGAAADRAKAAALKSVGSGTAGEVTTDFTGKGYEVTVTKPSGSKVEVHLDSSFQVMQRAGGSRSLGGGHGPGGYGTGQGGSGTPGPGSAGGAPPAGYRA